MPKVFFSGLVWNRSAPGVLGDSVLKIYVGFDPNRSSLGTISDDIHPEVNCHIAVNPPVTTITGTVIRSNTPANVGLLAKLEARDVQGWESNDLKLTLGTAAFSGSGIKIVGFTNPIGTL